MNALTLFESIFLLECMNASTWEYMDDSSNCFFYVLFTNAWTRIWRLCVDECM